MRAVAAFLALLTVANCGVDYSKRTYEHVGSVPKPAEGVVSLYVGSDSTNKMKIGAPYAAIVSLTTDAPFTVKSVVYEHDGSKVTVIGASSSAVKSRPRGNTTKKMQVRSVKVPLDDLKWVAGSVMTLRAEVLADGATKALIAEMTFEATSVERQYSCSEYYSML